MIDIKKIVRDFSIYQNHYQDINLDTISHTELPSIDKAFVIKDFPARWSNDFLQLGIKNNAVEYITTSGTTGEAMQIIRKANWWKDEYARISAYHPFLHELYFKNKRKAVLTTAICSNTVCYRDNPSLEKRIKENTLYLNYHADMNKLTIDNVKRIIDEYNDFAPYNLDADPIYLAILLKLKNQYEITTTLHQPNFISFSYEFCPINCYNYIKQFFHVPIMQMYGLTELGYIYFRVDQDLYQPFADKLQLQFEPIQGLDDCFELIVTSIKNEYMPFINYKTGDIVVIDAKNQHQIKSNPSAIRINGIAGRKKNIVTSKKQNEKFCTLHLDKYIADTTSKILYYKIEISDTQVFFQYVTNTDLNLDHSECELLKAGFYSLFNIDDITLCRRSSILPEFSGKYTLLKGA